MDNDAAPTHAKTTPADSNGLPPGARPAAVAGQPPMLVYAWRDTETDASGWIAIEADDRLPHVGGGGLFVSANTTEAEVVDVARSMARKLRVTCAAGAVRGAKGGVRYDPTASDVGQVIGRFMAANAAVIREAWATGADLNTDHHTLDALARKHVGVPHCLYALASRYPEAQPTRLLGVVAPGAPQDPIRLAWPRFGVAEAVVGYGVARALREITPDGSLNGLEVAVQGFGTVGATFALYAQALGARVVAVADRDHFVARPGGIDVRALLLHRQHNVPSGSAALANCFAPPSAKTATDERGDGDAGSDLVARRPDETDDAWLNRLLDACVGGIDVFAPCAQRYVMTPTTTRALGAAIGRRRATAGAGRRAYVASGANNITADPPALEAFLDAHDVWMVPEWVSNAGTACLFMEASTMAPPACPDYEAVVSAAGDRVAAFVARAKIRAAAAHADNRGAARPSGLLAACHDVADDALASRS
ncbi:Glutamate dehydrogenase [Pandoravirus salinus]|uniref:Glutamate dehydrogenase n=1 Tax=Pandoravirus salinus TaxID=1349410 RepID=S4VYP3_9VIRU|nr:NAD(P) binding incomplete domain [Pandoravirus salinus]AGO84591.1 Glutamate dehydrogenase [Pandoravirus salinus]